MKFFRKLFCKHPRKKAKETKRYFKVTADYISWHVKAYKEFECSVCGSIIQECVYSKQYYTRPETIESIVYLMGFDYENYETIRLL